MHTEAEELNAKLARQNGSVYRMLSRRGREIYFPKMGIISQTAEGKGKRLNATIGIATEEGRPMHLSAIKRHVDLEPEFFGYANSYGDSSLREKWRKMMLEKNTIKGEVSLPVVTVGVTHGLSIAGYLFVDEGDEIIIPDLHWENYELIFSNTYGSRLKAFEMFSGDSFNSEGFRDALKGKKMKRIVLLNFPNNPTGYTATEAEINEIVDIIDECAETDHDIVVLVDDAYFGLVYKDGFRESVFSRLCNLHERVLAVKLDGATKEDYVWGFRVGFVTYGCRGMKDYTTLEAKTAGAVRASVSNAPNVSQQLLLKAWSDPCYEREKRGKYEILRKRFEKVIFVLEEHPEYRECFEALPFNSGYFMCLRVKNAEDVRKRLLKQYDTAVIAFDGLIRVAFSSLEEKEIPDVFENIYRCCKELDDL